MRNKKLLLHTCCAPCVLPILEYLKDKDLDITLYYFNPNILNREEYKKNIYFLRNHSNKNSKKSKCL